MSVFTVTAHHLSAAATTVTKAAGDVRSRDSSDHLLAAGWALPGADSLSLLSQLGVSWDEELDVWADAAEAFATAIAATGDDAQGTDQAGGALFAGLLGIVGGG